MTVDEAIERLTEFKRVYGGDCELIAKDWNWGKLFDVQDTQSVKARNHNNQCLVHIREYNAND